MGHAFRRDPAKKVCPADWAVSRHANHCRRSAQKFVLASGVLSRSVAAAAEDPEGEDLDHSEVACRPWADLRDAYAASEALFRVAVDLVGSDVVMVPW